MDIKKLKEILIGNSIDTSMWGNGAVKSVSDLLLEINKKEIELVEEDGVLFRNTQVALIRIFYKQGNDTLVLKEKYQEFSNGKKRIRKKEELVSVSEKMPIGERPQESFARALSEELGITTPYTINLVKTISKIKESPSYPNLKTKYTYYIGELYLNDADYKKDGYVEFEKCTGITTYFVWEKLLSQ